jgi:hypothetical protein
MAPLQMHVVFRDFRVSNTLCPAPCLQDRRKVESQNAEMCPCPVADDIPQNTFGFSRTSMYFS